MSLRVGPDILPPSTPTFVLLLMTPMSGLQESQVKVQEQEMFAEGAPFLKGHLLRVRIFLFLLHVHWTSKERIKKDLHYLKN